MTNLQPRIRSTHAHDDGADRWQMASIAPPAALAGLIQGYSDYAERTGSFTTRRELPHAQAVLIVNLAAPLAIVGGNGRELVLDAGEAFIAGAHLRPALSRSTGVQAGMHVFLPLASLRRLIGIPMDRIVDEVLPLSALLGDEAARFCRGLANAPNLHERVQLLDAALLHRFAMTPALAKTQLQALALLRDRPDLDILDIARQVGWSRKHLASRVRDAVGVGPRSWRRLIRFEKLTRGLGANPARDWAATAYDAGYCDQSHLIREFREFAQMTPSEYVARSLENGGGLVER